MRAAVVAAALLLAACGRDDFDPLAHVDAPATSIDAPADARRDAAPVPITQLQHMDLAVSTVSMAPVTLSNAVNVGDLIVVAYDFDNTPTPDTQITDTLGNAYHVQFSSTSGLEVELAYAISAAAGSDTVTVALSSANNNTFEVHVVVYGGIAADPFDAGMIADGTAFGTDAATTGTFTTTAANELIFGFCGAVSTNPASAGTGFTLVSPFDGDVVEDKLVATAGASAVTATVDSTIVEWTIVGAAFRGQ